MVDLPENLADKQNSRPGFKKVISKVPVFFYSAPRLLVRYFLHGLIIVLPLSITLWVLFWLFNLVDGFLSPLLELVIGRYIPGLGFGIIVIMVLLIGFIGMRIGRTKFFDPIEKNIVRIPGIGAIYGGTREILNAITPGNSNKFLEVVLLEFPRKGIYAVGLVTKETQNINGEKYLNVFIPTSPTPTGGYLQIVRESEVVHTSMSISDAMKLIVSIGRLSKEDFAFDLTKYADSSKEN